MNNNYNIIRIFKERVLKEFYPVYHAPLVFDITTQRCYRKAGYVSWPETKNSGPKAEELKEKGRKRSDDRPYFAYPSR
jgi:hypothetical protein